MNVLVKTRTVAAVIRRRLDETELGQRGDAVVEADLLCDPAVDHLEHRRAGEAHLAAGRGGKAADQEIVEGRTGVGSAAFPLANHIVAFGDQIGGPPEVEVGERRAKVGHERSYVVAAAARRVQRIFQEHVRGGDLIDDREIQVLAPEFGEPAAHHGLVVVLLAHGNGSSRSYRRIIEIAR